MTNKKEHYFLSKKLDKAVAKLSQKANPQAKFRLQQLQGGRNNRVFCVAYYDGRKALLKAYFQHQVDKRKRLKTEYSFLNFAWAHNIRCLPKPLAADFKNNLGLYEFIKGHKLSSYDIDNKKIQLALSFFTNLNDLKDTKEARKMPFASDACFSIKEHFDHVERRIKRLKKINNSSEINRKAISFFENKLLKEWEKVKKYANGSISDVGLDFDKPISIRDRCISPSDFGYHNALIDLHGSLYFLDFEYAGLDDPAKMVCDFFCQPEVQVPLKYFDFFVKKVVDNTSDPEKYKRRIHVLFPIYKIKWCCILLNDFLELDSERRSFAYGKIDYEKEKIKQLEKAKEYLEGFK